MQYVQVSNGAVKAVLFNQLIAWNANNYCTPQALINDGKADAFGVYPLVNTAQPAFDSITQSVREIDPALVDGNWTQRWEVYDLSAEEVAQRTEQQAQSVRAERNTRLAASDWTQGKDIPDNVSAAWAAYRQALRDVPKQTGFPWSVEWPAKPE